MDIQWDDLFHKESTWPSVSQGSVLLLFVKKKNQALWLCVDYKK